MQIRLFENDLPREVLENKGSSVAIDTETMGLLPHRDRLCLVQLCFDGDECFLVQTKDYSKANNLRALLLDASVLKIFHYARFDMMMLYQYLGVMSRPVFCTKIASKLSRTYTSAHSLKALCLELLGIELSKEETCSDWGAAELSQKQKEYAANDVLYLHALKAKLTEMLKREQRLELAKSCFKFLPTRVLFDLMIDSDWDVFEH